MNSRYIRLHVISNPFVSGGGSSIPTNIANSLEESTDDDLFVPSITLLKQYIQNASLGNVFSNGTHLSFYDTTLQGEVGIDIIGPESSLSNKTFQTQYDSMYFNPTDFHLSTLSGKLNVQTRALKYVSVDDNPTHLSQRLEGLNFRSNRNIRIENEIANNRHNVYFHLLRYNDIYSLLSDTVIPADSPTNTPFVWNEMIHNQEIVLNPITQCYVYTGTTALRCIIHFQFLYQWVGADIPYRFRINLYTVLNGQRTDVFSDYSSIENLVDTINSYTNTFLLQLTTNEEIHVNILFDAPYDLRILETSYFYTEYIE